MKTYTLETGDVNRYYFIYIPKNIAEHITTHHTDNFNGGYTNTLSDGIYHALLRHDEHCTNPYKYWEIQESDMDYPIELEDTIIKGVLASDLKQLLN